MKKLSLLLFMACFAFGLSAQRTISGTVIDNAGEALIGVNITAAGTTVGTISDIDGTYSLSVPEGSTTLIFSYTGYTTQEVAIGNSSVMDLTLSEGLELEEIVVTGLGIKKSKKALGYGVTTLGEDALANRQEADVARILRGKATGVDITQTSGMAGSGTNVIIRGYSSITGDNQPLFVVDGVPFNTDTNSDRSANTGGATASSRFLDLDPNSIAEISILKGLSATVLYGEAGRNGVVLVTTKNGDISDGASNKGFEVSVSQSIAQTEIANLPNYQNSFGNGFSGNFGWFFSNWGPNFDTRGSNGIDEAGQIDHPYSQGQFAEDFPELQGARYDYRSYQPVEGFFDKGSSYNTSLNISKNFNGGGFNASYSYLTDQGFTPDRVDGSSSNNLNKHNLGLGATASLDNGLKVSSTFNFVVSDRLTPPAAFSFGSGSGGNASLFGDVFYTPRSIDLNNLPFQSPVDGRSIYYRRGSPIQNPYWTVNNQYDEEDITRFFGTVNLTYPIADWLTAQYRVGIDQYTQQTRRFANKGGRQLPNGELSTAERLNKITDHFLGLLFNKYITDDIDIDGMVGFNGKKETRDFTVASSTNQFVFDFFKHQNFTTHNNRSFDTAENLLGLFGSVTLGYGNYLYVNVQARNDWTSTLEAANRSVFYPSASVSFIPTEAISSLVNNSTINYLKLRAGIGTSAGYPSPYGTRSVLGTGTNVFVPQGAAGEYNTNTVANFLGNPNLTPERHTEIELGVEARMLNNRFGVDLSLYDKTSSDLIVDLQLDPATGFSSTRINAAEVTNKGIELGLNFVPVRGDFTWDFTLNYTRNRNIVNKVADGVDQFPFGGGFSNLGNFAIPGEPYGVIQGLPFERNDQGQLLVGADGNYVPGQDIAPIGNPNPNFNANWINNFSYKGLSVGFQFQYQDGGDIYSVTTATMLARGLTEDTNVDRFLPIIQPGVLASDGSTPNDIQGYIGDFFFRSYFFADEGTIFDATNVRLREASVSYSVPESLLTSTPFGRLGITFSGENLWVRAPNFPEHVNFDPDVASLGVGNGRGFDFITGPTAKKFGVTLNATF